MAGTAERFHIVPVARRATGVNSGAALLGVPTAEYVRRAVASLEAGMTTAEVEALTTLAGEVELAAGRMAGMIDRSVAIVDRPIDDDAMRAAVAALLVAHPVRFDPAILDFATSPAA